MQINPLGKIVQVGEYEYILVGLVLCCNGSLYVGGDFDAVNGMPRNNLAKFDSGGNLMSFNPNINNAVRALAIDTNGES